MMHVVGLGPAARYQLPASSYLLPAAQAHNQDPTHNQGSCQYT